MLCDRKATYDDYATQASNSGIQPMEEDTENIKYRVS